MGFLNNFKQPLIIAEISGNHGGSFDKAKALVLQSAEAGADYVKLQTYKPETITVGGNGEGSASNQLNIPEDVSIDSNGNIYVSIIY